MTRKEGDVWTKGSKQWTMQNGIIQSVQTVRDKSRQLLMQPLCCPNCSKVMKGRLDEKMWNFYSKCFDCIAKMQTKMMLDGTWEAYEKSIIENHTKLVLNDFISEMKAFIETNPTNQMITECGDQEDWSGQSVVKQNVESQIEFLKTYMHETTEK